MNWSDIIIAALGLFAAGDLVRLIFFRASKKEAEAKADGVIQENESAAVATLERAIEQMGKTNEAYAQMIEQLRHERDEEHARSIAKDESIATLQTLICKHMGCSIREPISGQGRKWFDDNKEDVSLALDFLPINQLMRRYGDKKRQLVEKEKTEDHETES